jgi:monomeric isocitrate dehydrogenase
MRIGCRKPMTFEMIQIKPTEIAPIPTIESAVSAAQTTDAALQQKFKPIAEALAAHDSKIVAELLAVQGQPVDIGGYYLPDRAKATAALRPSATFNAIIDGMK